ncbi:hypothetical protein KEM48_002020 [Puccinia striiformis f. sp. tritici PST-130]|nr:hypothetical protein KEM48_002020 [Puccinia striiformis f. sp. tritici PST-130]
MHQRLQDFLESLRWWHENFNQGLKLSGGRPIENAHKHLLECLERILFEGKHSLPVFGFINANLHDIVDGPPAFDHTDLDLQVSKRHACQPADDISESSNFIDRRSNSDSAQISKFPLDIQSSRSNNDNRVLQQDKDLNRSHLNKTNELSLLERITLPPEDNSQIV